MDPEGTLGQLGLNVKESRVYSGLLELGETTVPPIANKTGIKRQTVYAVLHALETKGFVTKSVKGSKMLFSAQHPQKLITEAEIRLKELQAAVPQLEAMMGSARERPRVMVYEGESALDRAWDDMFIAQGEVLYAGNIALARKVFSRTFQKLQYVKYSSDFRTRELLNAGPESEKYAQESTGPFRSIRFIREEFSPYQADIGVFGNTVVITSVKDAYFSTKIESSDIAHAFRAFFEAMWRLSRE